MILNASHIKQRINLIDNYEIVLFKHKKTFEVKIVDNYDYIIIDNDFISNKPLAIAEYKQLCLEQFEERLEQGICLLNLSIQ